jgi:hypothetical protein
MRRRAPESGGHVAGNQMDYSESTHDDFKIADRWIVKEVVWISFFILYFISLSLLLFFLNTSCWNTHFDANQEYGKDAFNRCLESKARS